MTQPFSFSVGLCQLSARPEAEPHDNITFYGFTRAVSGRYRDERIASSPSPDEFSHSNADIVGHSPASDLAARRGVFSRRHYGSVETLISVDSNGSCQTAGRFRVETGEREREEVGTKYTVSSL
ncbi:hypothetical protein LSAT2_018607 [Lamellibrachia satsuma]|nr:hypothetical protein LSAT2_018607 [Lamellibrachia satsuma]